MPFNSVTSLDHRDFIKCYAILVVQQFIRASNIKYIKLRVSFPFVRLGHEIWKQEYPFQIVIIHDDVIKRKHFPRYWLFV